MPFRNIGNDHFFCHYCDKTFDVFKNLRNHVNEKHKNIKEEEINRTIRSPKDFVKADLSDISCRLCGSNFTTIERLVEHLKGLHNKTYHDMDGLKYSYGIMGFNLSGGKLKCFVCSQEFRCFKNLSVHMNEHGTDFLCWICGKRLITHQRLRSHIYTHMPSNIKCKYCPETFKSVSAKNRHSYKYHTRGIVHRCLECGETFSNYQLKLTHMTERHKFKKPAFTCKYCKKHYANRSALSGHIRYVHFTDSVKKHDCEICDKSFITTWLLRRHLEVHAGRKLFKCQYCGKQYAKKYTLNMHIKIHLNEKQHICKVCHMAFVQRGTLRIHMKGKHPDIDIKTI